MTLTRKQIREIIFSTNIRNYHKYNIFGLMLENMGFKHVHEITIKRYGETCIVYLKKCGTEILWSEKQVHLDIRKTINPRYKFIIQIYKDLPNTIKIPKLKTHKDIIIDIKAILAKYN